MNHLLEKLLKKRNIEDVSLLRFEEKEDFDRWEAILSEGEVTVSSIEAFCRNQIGLIEAQWKNLDNPPQKNERLILLHTVYQSLLGAINSPQKQERESLEKYLSSLL